MQTLSNALNLSKVILLGGLGFFILFLKQMKRNFIAIKGNQDH